MGKEGEGRGRGRMGRELIRASIRSPYFFADLRPWVGCYIWYSQDGPGRAAAPPSPILAVANPTHQRPVSQLHISRRGTIITLQSKGLQRLPSVHVQTWFDYRLQWNATEFDDVTSIYVPVTKIWLPDYALLNKLEIYNITRLKSCNLMQRTHLNVMCNVYFESEY